MGPLSCRWENEFCRVLPIAGQPRNGSCTSSPVFSAPVVWSLAAMHSLSVRLGRRVGGSTGTNLVAALACAQSLRSQARGGSIVTLLCDDGQRYRHSYFDDDWLLDNCLECGVQSDAIDALLDGSVWPEELRRGWRLAGDLSLSG